jgi:hypothetical protein
VDAQGLNLVALSDELGTAMADRNPLDALPPSVKARLRKRPQPEWVAPMLATLTDERFSREGWLFEPSGTGNAALRFATAA